MGVTGSGQPLGLQAEQLWSPQSRGTRQSWEPAAWREVLVALGLRMAAEPGLQSPAPSLSIPPPTEALCRWGGGQVLDKRR